MDKLRACLIAAKNISVGTITHCHNRNPTAPTQLSSNIKLAGVAAVTLIIYGRQRLHLSKRV
jgi:hypothetical protein